jgi:hypothetical protein
MVLRGPWLMETITLSDGYSISRARHIRAVRRPSASVESRNTTPRSVISTGFLL